MWQGAASEFLHQWRLRRYPRLLISIIILIQITPTLPSPHDLPHPLVGKAALGIDK